MGTILNSNQIPSDIFSKKLHNTLTIFLKIYFVKFEEYSLHIQSWIFLLNDDIKVDFLQINYSDHFLLKYSLIH